MTDVFENGPGTVSVKFGSEYDAPLFVARGTIPEMGQQLIEAFGLFGKVTNDNTLAEITALAGATARGLYAAYVTLGGQNQQQPQSQPQAGGWGSQSRGQDNQGDVQSGQPSGGNGASPGGNCPHGPRVWKEGTGKNSGKSYKGWFCAANQRDCKPEFVN